MRYRLLLFLLRKISRLALRRHKPTIIAVTGSVGKTSTRRAIMTVLRAQYYLGVRSTVGNRNAEISVPLAILGLTPGGQSTIIWSMRIVKGLLVALFDTRYPKVLVLEMSADKPGNISELAKLAPPKITVVTEIGEIPRHVEHYAGPKNFAREQARLVEALPVDGWAVLNGEDPSVLAMRDRTGAHVRTYGFAERGELDVGTIAFEFRSRHENGEEIPDGVSFKIEYRGKVVPVRLSGTYGRGIVRAALAGAAVGLAMDMNLVEISEALAGFEGPPGRLRLLAGLKRTTVIDDSYDASPPSLKLALHALAQAPATRRVVVLGDMSGLGRYSDAAHQEAGERAAEVADVVVTVGTRMRLAAEEAEMHGVAPEYVRSFSTAAEASDFVKETIAPGDVILVTGARELEMEYVVEAIVSS